MMLEKKVRRIGVWVMVLIFGLSVLAGTPKASKDSGYRVAENPFCIFVYKPDGTGYIVLKPKAFVYCFLAPWKKLQHLHFQANCESNPRVIVDRVNVSLSLNAAPAIPLGKGDAHGKANEKDHYILSLICTDWGRAARVSVSPLRNSFVVTARAFNCSVKHDSNPAIFWTSGIQGVFEKRLLGKDAPKSSSKEPSKGKSRP